jgi:alpha-glucan,water dikinase
MSFVLDGQVLDEFFEVDQGEAMADIYVWLRYSASRQLTWQRNYNTQPRILSAAQVRRLYCGVCIMPGLTQASR